MGDAIFTRPNTEDVLLLKTCRIYLTANPLDILWKGLHNFNIRAWRPNINNIPHVLPDHTLAYFPQYPKDWYDHPGLWRAMEFLIYDVKMEKRGWSLFVRNVAPGTRFLRAHESWRKALCTGKRTHQDLYAEMDRGMQSIRAGKGMRP